MFDVKEGTIVLSLEDFKAMVEREITTRASLNKAIDDLRLATTDRDFYKKNWNQSADKIDLYGEFFEADKDAKESLDMFVRARKEYNAKTKND